MAKQRRVLGRCKNCVSRIHLGILLTAIALIFFITNGLAPHALAQTATAKPAPKVQKPAAPARSPAWVALDAARKLKVDVLIKYVKAHPSEFDDSMLAYNTGFGLEPYIKANLTNPAKLRKKLIAMNAAFSAVSPNGRTNYYWAVAGELFKHDAALDLAADLARKSVDEITEKELIASYREEHERYMKYRAERAKKENKKEEDAEPFDENDAVLRYKREMSTRLTLLGKTEIKLNHNEAAETALKRAIEFKSNSSALLNLARLAAGRGDKAQALSLYTAAYLRGQMSSAEIDELKKIYFELHPGSNDEALTHYLDDEYDKTFKIPAEFAPYKADPQRTKNVVLFEVFTGAGCESCVSVDLAADAMLQRYSRGELVLLTYQTSAPTSDPLSNRTVELREDYYQTQRSAPHEFIEGKEIRAEGEAPHTQEVLDKLDNLADEALVSPEGGDLHVSAVRSGNSIRVQVTGSTPKPPESGRLQIMLVETDVTYSGENGLRYHPMVVRASANRTDTATGYPVTEANFKFEYTFDLEQITADNLKWYDDYLAALKKRLPPGFDIGGFKEKKNAMNPAKLAVVVFLQDDKSKSILQVSFSAVETSSRATQGGSGHGL